MTTRLGPDAQRLASRRYARCTCWCHLWHPLSASSASCPTREQALLGTTSLPPLPVPVLPDGRHPRATLLVVWILVSAPSQVWFSFPLFSEVYLSELLGEIVRCVLALASLLAPGRANRRTWCPRSAQGSCPQPTSPRPSCLDV